MLDFSSAIHFELRYHAALIEFRTCEDMAMISAKTLLISTLLLSVVGCASAPATDDSEEIARREAEFETQRLFEEAVLQEQREKAATERAILEQQALREQTNRAEAEARSAEENQNRNEQSSAQREADLRAYRERNAEPAERNVEPTTRNAEPATAEKAQEVARVQARVDELRQQIAVNRTETENLENSNAALREAIAAAEDLSRTLAEEQAKYTNTDPATGQPVDVLAKARIDELKAQVERLKAQAAALSQPAP